MAMTLKLCCYKKVFQLIIDYHKKEQSY